MVEMNILEKRAYKVVEARSSQYGYPACEECGSTKWLEMHHVIYRSQGGLTEPDNLVLLCKRCHGERHGERVVDSEPMWKTGGD